MSDKLDMPLEALIAKTKEEKAKGEQKAKKAVGKGNAATKLVKSAAVSKKEKQKQGGGLPRAKPINLAALPNLTITVATGSAGQQRQAPQNRPGARRPVAGNKLKQRLGQRLGQGKTNRGGKPGQGGGKPGQQRAGGGKPGQQRAGGSKPSGGKGGRKIIVR